MSAHVSLNLLNELGKRDKMRGLPSILSLFRNEFNKFNNTRARMLDRGSNMSAHVLLNLLNELGKRDKMRGLWFTDFIAWRYFTPRRDAI